MAASCRLRLKDGSFKRHCLCQLNLLNSLSIKTGKFRAGTMTLLGMLAKLSLVTMVLLLICFLPCFTPVCLAHKNKSLNPEWLHNDLQGIGIVLRTIPKDDHNRVEDLKRSIKGEWTIEDDDLGFGARKLSYSKGFGYTSIYVDVVSFNGEIGFYEISFSKPNEWPLMRKKIIKTWNSQGGPPFKEDEDKFFFQKRFHRVFDLYYKAVAEQLGAMRSVRVPSELRVAYDYLISPLNNSTVGNGSCGLDGPILEGRRSIDLLAKAKRVDLIENVLRGYNPGGRIFAAITLLKMKEMGLDLDPETTGTIEKVGALDIPIAACAGCIVKTGLKGKDVINAYVEGTGFSGL